MKVKSLSLMVMFALSMSTAQAAIDEQYIDYKPSQTTNADADNNNDAETTTDENEAASVEEKGLAIGAGSKVVSNHDEVTNNDDATFKPNAGGVAIAHHQAYAEDSAVAIGNNSRALRGSVAIGLNAVAGSDSTGLIAGSVAIGHDARADNYGLGVGLNAYAEEGSVALGNNSTAGAYSVSAGGARAIADGEKTAAFGYQSHATHTNSVAIGSDSITSDDDTVSFGNEDLQRQLIWVADGEIAEDSKDAVNGSQLFVTNQNISKVGDKIENVNNILTELSLIDAKNVVMYDNEAHDSITLKSATDGNVKLTGLADATLAADSTGAINGAQLYQTNQNIANLGQQADQLHQQMITKSITKEQAKNAVRYDSEAHDSITLTSTTGENVALSGLKDGELSATSTDAVTGNQLFQTGQQISRNTTEITNLETEIAEGSIGLVKKDSATKQITIGKEVGGSSISFAGAAGDRVVSGVADAVADNDAINLGQLQTYAKNAAADTKDAAEKVISESKTYTDKRIKSLASSIDRKNRKQDAGIASAVAIGSIPQNWEYDNNLGMSVGGYNGQGAIALKYGHKLKDNARLALSVGLDSTGTAAYAGGLGFGW